MSRPAGGEGAGPDGGAVESQEVAKGGTASRSPSPVPKWITRFGVLAALVMFASKTVKQGNEK